MKKILLGISLILVLFIAYLLFNVMNFKSSQLEVSAIDLSAVPAEAANRLSEAISIRTVSFEKKEDFDSTQFELFNQFLDLRYGLVDSLLEHKIFNKYSHLYTWQGDDPSLKPIVLMAHLDVVPIASFHKWTVHPFTEGIRNDTIYGRGAMDDKFALISILESVQQLLQQGFTPKRTVYLSFGHDEEIGGQLGAVPIAAYLKEQGVEASFVLDEGQAITERMIPGLDQQLALIGIAEKGITTIELSVDMIGGHSSMPAPETAIDVLASAVANVKNNPMEAAITPALKGFIDKVGPEMDFKARVVFSNLSLFKSTVLGLYEKGSPAGNATIRTTTSPTVFQAGIKENVIPTSARALINFRIIPGETGEDVMEHVRQVVNDDRVQIRFYGFKSNPSPISPSEGDAFNVIDQSIKEVYPGMLTAPSLVIAATDSRHFKDISPNVYRFAPNFINPENLACFHGIDERVSVDELENGIRFYQRVIINSSL